ncbi:choice-of-anchor Q domain-containing protein [Anaerolineales bacterium HSG25]|nr:choice-of-anchor Q domain-containing protein [Anaerolineales bacterium HSG25]
MKEMISTPQLLHKQPSLPLALIVLAGVVITLMLNQTTFPRSAQSARPKIVVSSTAMTVSDDGQCTLIEAIISANTDTMSGLSLGECLAGDGSDIIELATGGLYLLDDVNNWLAGPNGLPYITSQIVINGNGAMIMREPTAPAFRLFQVVKTGDLKLNHVTLTNGFADGTFPANNGGSIFNSGGILTLFNSTLHDNRATESGGAVFVWDEGTVTAVNTTLSGNQAGHHGGGIFNKGSQVTLVNSTLTDNVADTDQNNFGDGGGIFNDDGQVGLMNSIVAGNDDRSTTQRHADLSGQFEGNHHNLISDITGGQGTVGFGSDVIAPNPGLQVLNYNGGLNKTHALSSDSPAIDMGDNLLCPAIDQRGVRRPQPIGANCDIGAFEVGDNDLCVDGACQQQQGKPQVWAE